MRMYVGNYQERADEAGRPADDELLRPILEGLGRPDEEVEHGV